MFLKKIFFVLFLTPKISNLKLCLTLKIISKCYDITYVVQIDLLLEYTDILFKESIIPIPFISQNKIIAFRISSKAK